MSSLRSIDPDQRSNAFERVICEAFHVEPKAEVEPLSDAYIFLSGALLERTRGCRSGGMRAPADATFDDRHVAAVWALIYGARTFHRAFDLLQELRPSPGLVVEVGAGWGPYGLAAAAFGHSVRLVEPASQATRLTGQIYAAAGFEPPQINHCTASAAQVDGASVVALPYSVWEAFEPDNAMALVRQLDRWLGQMAPTGQVHLLEAGTRPATRALQAVRDLCAEKMSILGPCRGVARCPLLESDFDWCHFTRSYGAGVLTREVANRARRRWQETHGSWLAVARRGGAEGGFRVLDVRPRGKAKLEASVCGPNGQVRVTALTRKKEVADHMSSLRSGDLVDIDVDRLTVKGDGLRLERPEELRLRPSGPQTGDEGV